jgi:hypothetical protein
MATEVILVQLARMSVTARTPSPANIRSFLKDNWGELATAAMVITPDVLESMSQPEIIPHNMFPHDFLLKPDFMVSGRDDGKTIRLISSIIVTWKHRFENIGGTATLVPSTHDVNYVECFTLGFTDYLRGQPFNSAKKIEGMDLIISAFLLSINEILTEAKRIIAEELSVD